MPPKAKSRGLVPTGPREVFRNSDRAKEKLKRPQKETTTRALVLRNGKYGARGSGEIILASRMTGREKLDLLAEDLVEKSKKAILRPFRLEECLKVAESQCDVYIDDITNLREADFFYHILEAELVARNSPNRETVRKNPSYVAKVVATRLHNSYMLASAWKIVSETLNSFAMNGIRDENIKSKLKNDTIIREEYLVLCDMVNTLVELSQNRFSVLATTAPHYARFFKLGSAEGTDPGEAEYIFDWTDLRGAATSFIDSIIIELCFPGGRYPEAILYQLLRDAITECPKDAKRFPQALWDAVGDLSVSVKLKEMLDVPLFGPEGEKWWKQPRRMSQDYDDWIDAQFYSREAADMFTNFKDVIFPLEKTRKQTNLDKMWDIINSNYLSVSGKDIDDLWKLTDSFNYVPQWTSYFVPGLARDKVKSESAVTKRKDQKKGKELLRLTNRGHVSTDSDMPPLQSLSGTDDGEDDDVSPLDDDDEDDDDDDESGYDTEEEDAIRDLLREAMDAAHEADWLSDSNLPKTMDPLEQEDRKGNPFLKLLGSLRGRMFSSSPKLKAQPCTRGATLASVPKPSAEPLRPSFLLPTCKTTDMAHGQETTTSSRSATVEDASDEEGHTASSSKKKKKKKAKKKNKSASVQSLVESITSASIDSMGTPPTSPKTASSASNQPAPPSAPKQASSAPKQSTPPIPKQASSTSSQPAHPASPMQPSNQPVSPKPPAMKAHSFMSSTTSLPVSQTTAQSARSYLQSLKIKSEKKVKSRPDHASIFSSSETKGFVTKFSMHKAKDEDKDSTVMMVEAKKSWFSKLGKKTVDLMHQLLKTSKERTGNMKWDDFVKLMTDMGFTYVPSTAGSSVRFDPPSKGDPPIIFHRRHPDPTLHGVDMKVFASRLKKRYGWDEADLVK